MYEELLELDKIRLNFTPGGLHVMNIAIGCIMFGVALDIKWQQFKDVFTAPKAAVLGLVFQFLLLPLVTFFAIWLAKDFITPGVAFGAILVAACPGGNISNFITSLANGNTALAVSLTAIGTVLAIVMTPFNFQLYGSLYMKTSALLVPIEIDPVDVARTVLILLGIPISLGIFVAYKFPKFVEKIKKSIKVVSLIAFVAIVVIAFWNNYNYFVQYIKLIFIIVLIHNGLALITSYWVARSFRLGLNDCRTLSIETGIQNSALALVLIFNPKIFPLNLEIGGMAFIAAWWGIWHIIACTSLAFYWRKRPV